MSSRFHSFLEADNSVFSNDSIHFQFILQNYLSWWFHFCVKNETYFAICQQSTRIMVRNCVPLQWSQCSTIPQQHNCEKEFAVVDAKSTCVDSFVTLVCCRVQCPVPATILDISAPLFPLFFFNMIQNPKPWQSRRC